jgi:hypothetical protein
MYQEPDFTAVEKTALALLQSTKIPQQTAMLNKSTTAALHPLRIRNQTLRHLSRRLLSSCSCVLYKDSTATYVLHQITSDKQQQQNSITKRQRHCLSSHWIVKHRDTLQCQDYSYDSLTCSVEERIVRRGSDPTFHLNLRSSCPDGSKKPSVMCSCQSSWPRYRSP